MWHTSNERKKDGWGWSFHSRYGLERNLGKEGVPEISKLRRGKITGLEQNYWPNNVRRSKTITARWVRRRTEHAQFWENDRKRVFREDKWWTTKHNDFRKGVFYMGLKANNNTPWTSQIYLTSIFDSLVHSKHTSAWFLFQKIWP